MCHNVELALLCFGDFSFFIHLFEYRKQEDNMSHRCMFAILSKKWGYLIVDLLYFTPSRWPLIFYCDENSPDKILNFLTSKYLDFVFGQQQNSLVSHYFFEIHWQVESEAMQAWQVIKARQRRDVQANSSPAAISKSRTINIPRRNPLELRQSTAGGKTKRQTFHLSQSWPGLTSSLRLAVSPCIGV